MSFESGGGRRRKATRSPSCWSTRQLFALSLRAAARNQRLQNFGVLLRFLSAFFFFIASVCGFFEKNVAPISHLLHEFLNNQGYILYSVFKQAF